MGRRRPTRGWAWAIALLPLFGCGTERAAMDMGRGGTQGAIQGLAETDPATLKKIRDSLLSDVELQRTAHEVARALVDGSAEGLRDTHLDAQVQALADALLLSVRKAGEGALNDLLTRGGPRLEAELQRSLTALIVRSGDTLARTTKDKLEPAASALVRSSVDVALAELAKGGPEALKQLSAPVGALTHSAGQELVRGVQDALPPEEAQRYAKAIGQGVVEGLRAGDNGTLSQGVSRLEAALIVAAGVLGTLLLALGASAGTLLRQHRRAKKSLAVLAGQIEKAPGLDDDARKALKKSIREGAEKNGVQDWLSDFLKERGL